MKHRVLLFLWILFIVFNIALVIMLLMFRFSHAELTETQLFLEIMKTYWPCIVIDVGSFIGINAITYLS